MRYILIALCFVWFIGCGDKKSDSKEIVADSVEFFDFSSLEKEAQMQKGNVKDSTKSMAKFYLLEGKIGSVNAMAYLKMALQKNAESKSFVQFSGKIVTKDNIFAINGEADLDGRFIPLTMQKLDNSDNVSQIFEISVFKNGEVSGVFKDDGFCKANTNATFKKASGKINEIAILSESAGKKIIGKDFDGSKMEFWHNISLQTPMILGESNAIDKINDTLKNIKVFENDDDEVSYNFEGISSFDVEYIDEKVIVFNHYVYLYSGGAHGVYGNDGMAFLLDNGERISSEAKTLLKNENDETLMAMIEARLKKEYGDVIDENISLSSFKITNDGVEFYWAIYEIAPYVAGNVNVKFAFSEIAPYVREDSPYYYKFQ